jgi:hypothetical protein
MSCGKSINVYCRQIFACIKQWSYDRRIPINTSIYLEGKTIKAIVDLKFNPEEGVAHISSATKGLSIMSCRGCTSAKTKCIHKREEAIAATENTRQLDKLLRLSKGVTRAPADNFWELKVNIATFMSLVWVLFGSECDDYNYRCGAHLGGSKSNALNLILRLCLYIFLHTMSL